MIFKTIADEANYYRDLTDYKLMGNGYVMVMLDGRSFSKMIKNKFKKPFDKDFINMMNETAKYICENVYGCVLGYVQSDEISLIIKDTNESDGFFGYRICKILSILSSMATGKFNQLMTLYQLKIHTSFACTARDHLLQALSIYNSAAPKKRRRHFTLRFSVRRAFVLQTTIGGRKLQKNIKV